MPSNENPATFFASMRETLGVLQMLEVKKDDREVCNLMLEGRSHEYKTLRETLVVFCPNYPSFMETKVRERYLDLQTQGGPKKHRVLLLLCLGQRGRVPRSRITSRSLALNLICPRKRRFRGSVSSVERRVT